MNGNLHRNPASDILVVDDTSENLKLLKEILTSQGYKVRPASNGEDALEAVNQRKPDLILLDIKMPGMDGYEVCRQLKAVPETHDIPIIFITASLDPKGVEKGLKLGAVDYINKPVREGEVLARVSTHLELYQMRCQLEQMVTLRTRALRKSDAKFRRLVEGLKDEYFFYVHGVDGIFSYLSPSIEQVTGYMPEDFMPHYSKYFTDNHINKQARKHTEQSMRGEQQPAYELEIYRKDGKRCWLEVKETPLLDDTGNVTAVEGIAHDITKRKFMDKALHRTQRMEAIGQLTGGIAHDFNNLLGIIIGYLDVLDSLIKNDEELIKHTRTVKKAAFRAADLTKQLLGFSRPQAQNVAPTNINQTIHGMEDLITRSVTPEIEVALHLIDDPWLTNIDKGDFEDALLNLIVNARDAMPEGGKITLETLNKILDESDIKNNPTLTPGEYVQLIVSDTGISIPAEDMEHVFEPFFTTKPPGKGSGLGLSMVFGFCKRSSGIVNINSEPGIGTTVQLYLPHFKRMVDEPVPVENENAGAVLPRGKETILVVDDEEDLLMLAQQYLQDLGYSTIGAKDGGQALDMLKGSEKIDLLFSDIVMPGGLNGCELAVKAVKQQPKLKVLLTSGFVNKALKTTGCDRFITELLTKPYRKSDLAWRVRKILDRRN